MLIQSAVNDNWTRVRSMHAHAKRLYDGTKHSEFRERTVNGGDVFPFDPVESVWIHNESSLVGLTMAWCVVTLECYANHQIASTVNHRLLATMAIEYPALVTDKLGLGKKFRSELAKKLVILSDFGDSGRDMDDNIFLLADTLSARRNHEVHDKPFYYLQTPDGDLDYKHFRTRGERPDSVHRFPDLENHYVDCDKIVEYIFDEDVPRGLKLECFSRLYGQATDRNR